MAVPHRQKGATRIREDQRGLLGWEYKVIGGRIGMTIDPIV